jgi:hypothetical protein
MDTNFLYDIRQHLLSYSAADFDMSQIRINGNVIIKQMRCPWQLCHHLAQILDTEFSDATSFFLLCLSFVHRSSAAEPRLVKRDRSCLYSLRSI